MSGSLLTCCWSSLHFHMGHSEVAVGLVNPNLDSDGKMFASSAPLPDLKIADETASTFGCLDFTNQDIINEGLASLLIAIMDVGVAVVPAKGVYSNELGVTEEVG